MGMDKMRTQKLEGLIRFGLGVKARLEKTSGRSEKPLKV